MVAELAGKVRDALGRLSPDDLRTLYERANQWTDPAKPSFMRTDYQAPESLLERGRDVVQGLVDQASPTSLITAGMQRADTGQQILGPVVAAGMAGHAALSREALNRLPSALADTWLPTPIPVRVRDAVSMDRDLERPAPDITPEALNQYGRDVTSEHLGPTLGSLAWESATDPMNYIPVGRLSGAAIKTGRALQTGTGAKALLGRLMEQSGLGGQQYQAAADTLVPEALAAGKTLLGAGRRIPVVSDTVEHLFSPSARSNVNTLVQNVGRTMESVVAALPGAGTYRQIVEPLGMALPEGQRMWPNLQQFWTAIEDSTMALDGWQRKTAALSLLKKVHLDKDLIDAAGAAERTAARKQTLLGEADPNYMYPDEFDAFKRVSYKRQGDSQRALQISTQEQLDALRDDITIPGADGSAHDEQISRLVDTTVEQMRQDVFRKRNLAQVAGEVLLPGNEDEFDELAGAMDTFYRQGRAAAINTAARGVDEIAGLLPGGLPEATGKLIDGTIHGYMSSTADLMKQVGPLEDRLSSLAVSEQGKRVLVDQEVALRAANRKTQALYYNVTRTATPILRQAIADNLLPMVDEGAEASVSHYLRDSFTAVQAMQDIKAKRIASGLPGDQAGMQKVITTLQKSIGDGDILQDGDWLQLSMRNFRNAVAPGMGVSTPPPWLTWPAGVLNMWKGTALLSPRFQFANLAFGLFSGDREGVAAGEVVKHLARNLSSLNQQILDMYAQQHGTTAAGMGNRQTVQAYIAAIMDRPDFKPTVAKDSARLQWGLGRRQGDAALFPGGDVSSSVESNYRGVPISGLKAQALWSGTMGVGGATAGAILPAEDEEARREQILRGAITGAASGATIPAWLWANKLLNRASEEAMRKTAIHAGMKRHMVGAHEQYLADIPTAQGRKVATDVRDVTRGGVPVERIEHVTGLPVAEVVPPGATIGTSQAPPSPRPPLQSETSIKASARTAITRKPSTLNPDALSKTAQLAKAAGVFRATDEVLDYGAGRGGDVAALAKDVKTIRGYDPAHDPDVSKIAPADVVQLSYVLNVIDDKAERANVLKTVYGLAKRDLIVGVRVDKGQIMPTWTPYRDGFRTGKGTANDSFQKIYDHAEAKTFIEDTLGVPAESLSTNDGIFRIRKPQSPQNVAAPWAVHMTADMSMGEAARLAADRAATEQSRRQFATHGQVQTVLDAFRDELRATHGPDILRNQFQLPGEDAERLALLEEAVVRLRKAQSLTPRMQEVLADLAPLEDISQFPVEVSAPTGMMLQGDVPEGALWKLQTWLQSRVQTEGELAGIMLVAPREIAEHAVGLGIDERTAATLGGQWDAIIREGEAAGLGLSNQIHGDYGDVNVLTEALRGYGVFPFMTFAVKQAPNMLTWLIQDPRLVIAIDRLNNLSEQEISEAGLPPKFERLASTGVLGDAIAGFVMGRPDATLMANVAGLINPYAEVGRGVNQVAPAPDRKVAGLQQLSDILGGVGLGIGPVPQLAGRVTGLLEDFGGPQLRTSSYIEALSGLGGGPQVNPEQVPIEIIRALRGGITGERQETLTGSSTKDYAVRQRIAEMAYEKTGKPPSQAKGDWLDAMDDPSSPIWKQALRQVERQRAGQTLVSSTLPFRTKLLSDTERTVTEARTRAGTSAAQLAALPSGTDAEKAAKSVELSRRFKAASTQNPTALVMSNLGGTDEQTGGRMYSAYLTKQKTWKGMSKQRRDAERKAYIEARPALGRYLAAHGYF